MTDKRFRFEQNKIVDTLIKKVYNVKDETDMKILCNDFNRIMMELHFKLDDDEIKLKRIKKIIGDME